MKSFVLVSVMLSISGLWLQHPMLLSHGVHYSHEIFHPRNRCGAP